MKGNLVKRALLYCAAVFFVFSCSKTDQPNPTVTGRESFTIDRNEALKLAVTGLNIASARSDGAKSKKVKEMKEFKEARGKTVFYSITYDDNKGFLLMSADRRLSPILAYSDQGSFDLNTDNPGILLWKDLVVDHFKGVEEDTKAHIDVENNWKAFEKNNISNGRTSEQPVWTPELSCEYFVTHPIPQNTTISNMTSSISTWRQGTGYNFYCPSATVVTCSGECGKSKTSCGAVAVGQVLNYHKKAITANGRNFTTAMFNNMASSLSSSNCSPTLESQTNVAHLLRDVGNDLDVHYNTPDPLLGGGLASGSGCQSWNYPGNLKDFFNNHGYVSNSFDFFGLNNESRVRDELLAHHPVIVFGAGCSTCLGSAHIWVIDGVQDLNAIYTDQQGYCYHYRHTMYQMNWGWGNSSENNTWFNYTGITGSGTLYNSSNMTAYTVVP